MANPCLCGLEKCNMPMIVHDNFFASLSKPYLPNTQCPGCCKILQVCVWIRIAAHQMLWHCVLLGMSNILRVPTAHNYATDWMRTRRDLVHSKWPSLSVAKNTNHNIMTKGKGNIQYCSHFWGSHFSGSMFPSFGSSRPDLVCTSHLYTHMNIYNTSYMYTFHISWYYHDIITCIYIYIKSH